MKASPTRADIDRDIASFDWSKIRALTDEQIEAAAKDDPDTYLPTEEELAEYDLVIPAKSRQKTSKPPEAAE